MIKKKDHLKKMSSLCPSAPCPDGAWEEFGPEVGPNDSVMIRYISCGSSFSSDSTDKTKNACWPHEFYNWVKETERKLRKEYDLIYNEAKAIVEDNKELSRKDFALKFGQHELRDVMFTILDRDLNKCSRNIWQRLRPGPERPFMREDTD